MALVCEETTNDDNSLILLNQATMDVHNLYRGDTAMIKGKKNKSTVCIVMDNDDCAEGKIQMGKVMRRNLRIQLGDTVTLVPATPEYGTRIHVLPFEDPDRDLPSNLFDSYLSPYFMEAYRPVKKGDIFVCSSGDREVEFKVMNVEPGDCCVVGPETTIYDEGDPVKREDEEDETGYDDIGGCDQQMTQIREMVELPLSHAELFTSIGIKPPMGMLMYGPTGCGKTLIARAVASETGVFFFLINGPEIMSKMAGESEACLRTAFEEAEKNAPSIIFIDEFDSIASKRGEGEGAIEKRIVSQLMTLMDGLKKRSRVFVLAATNRPDALDSALLRPGRLDQLIHIPLPDKASRKAILNVAFRNAPREEDVDIDAIVSATQGFSGADLVGICQRAAVAAIRESIAKKSDAVPPITREHIEESMKGARRSVSDADAQMCADFGTSLAGSVRKDGAQHRDPTSE